ncbi:hypothetical protein CC80DRAFT_496005 [Byssothecium circinans]|uniref:Peptidase A1 domain-containing protein n=1 Tax=Byssothecium circinans TaxID=147558 RepID=A0A6A5TIZ2_9PLEO|nr:hypothetical protein CC80DRAFT_496005 [Byssothecium circinans]
MLHLLVLAIAPTLVSANGLAEWQQPLSKHPGEAKCGRGRKGLHYGSAFSFFLNGDWRYYFSDYFPGDGQCGRGELTPLSMKALDDISNRIAPPKPKSDTGDKKSKNEVAKKKAVSLMLSIPQGTEEEGPLIIEPEPQWKLFHEWDLSVEIQWAKSKLPGRGLNITSIGIRQGSTSTSKTSHVPLNFGTPFTNLPADVFDLLAASTRPQRTDMGRGIKPVETVDCNAVKDFPDIILNFEEDGFELVVKPEQYILSISNELGGLFKGQCVLMVSRGGEVSLGWAALRGMTVWMDWVNARTGFGRPKR